MDQWTDIVSIDSGYSHTVGLKSDGTVVAAGRTQDGECEVEGWTNIIDVAASYGLRLDYKPMGFLSLQENTQKNSIGVQNGRILLQYILMDAIL